MRDGSGAATVGGTGEAQTAVRRRGLPANLQRSFLLISLVFVFLVMGFVEPRFLSAGNLVNIARQISINLIIGVGMTFCIISGGSDLSVGPVGAMAGCVAGVVIVGTGNVLLGLLGGLLAGSLAGLLNGISISILGVNPFVATLGMNVIARGVALILTGGDVIYGLPSSFNLIGVGMLGPVPIPVIIAAGITAVGHLILTRTEYGLNVYAVGGNYNAAKLAGIKCRRVIATAFTMQGLLAALGGIVLAARVVSAQPALMSDTSLEVIGSVVIGGTSMAGGKGSIGGTVLGCILTGSLYNGLNLIGVGYEWQLVVVGAITIVAVMLDSMSRR